MKYRLPGVGADVGHKAVSLFQAKVVRDLSRGHKNLPQHIAILRRQFGHRSDMTAGNKQNMLRGLGMNIPEGYNVVVIVNYGGRDLTCYNFTKQTVLHMIKPLFK